MYSVVGFRQTKVCRLLSHVPLFTEDPAYLGVGQGFRRGVMAFGATRPFNLGV